MKGEAVWQQSRANSALFVSLRRLRRIKIDGCEQNSFAHPVINRLNNTRQKTAR